MEGGGRGWSDWMVRWLTQSHGKTKKEKKAPPPLSQGLVEMLLLPPRYQFTLSRIGKPYLCQPSTECGCCNCGKKADLACSLSLSLSIRSWKVMLPATTEGTFFNPLSFPQRVSNCARTGSRKASLSREPPPPPSKEEEFQLRARAASSLPPLCPF